MKTWIVTKIVREEYEVIAENKDEAISKAQDPYEVIIIKEIVRRLHRG